jgi:mRNA interferase MazF
MESTDPRRGEIWLVAFGAARKGEPGKNRPAIVISANDLLTGVDDELIVVIPLSSSRKPSRLRPEISPDEGIDSPSVVVCRGIRAVARRRLLRPIGTARLDTLREVETALAAILSIER